MTEPDTVAAEDARLIAKRAHWKEQKRLARQRQAEIRAAVADKRGAVQAPDMPKGLAETRAWLRQCHNLYSARKMTSQELEEVRKSARTQGDLYRVGADMKKAVAALRAAQAQERMAETLASIEHGSTALVMLERLQASLSDNGPRRALPISRASGPRVIPAEPDA